MKTFSEIFINLNSVTDDEKKILSAILKKGINEEQKKFSKKIPIEISVDRKDFLVTLSHTLRQSTRENKPVFNIKQSGQMFEIGRGTFGKVSQFEIFIRFIEVDEFEFVQEKRVNKKQVCKISNEEEEKKFRQRILDEYIASKVLYQGQAVDVPWFSRDKKGRLVAHQSLPYLGIAFEKKYFDALPLLIQLYAIRNLANQLVEFHQKEFAHRDIKPANTVFNEFYHILMAVDPGWAMHGDQKRNHRGTREYLPYNIENELKNRIPIDVNKAKKLDVYAFGLTIAVLYGFSSQQLEKIYNGKYTKIPINFFTTLVKTIDDEDSLVNLNKLLIQMTNQDLNVPTIEVCLDELTQLEINLYLRQINSIKSEINQLIKMFDAIKIRYVAEKWQSTLEQLQAMKLILESLPDTQAAFEESTNTINPYFIYQPYLDCMKQLQACSNSIKRMQAMCLKVDKYLEQLKKLQQKTNLLSKKLIVQKNKIFLEKYEEVQQFIDPLKQAINHLSEDQTIMENIATNKTTVPQKKYAELEQKFNRAEQQVEELKRRENKLDSFINQLNQLQKKIEKLSKDLEETQGTIKDETLLNRCNQTNAMINLLQQDISNLSQNQAIKKEIVNGIYRNAEQKYQALQARYNEAVLEVQARKNERNSPAVLLRSSLTYVGNFVRRSSREQLEPSSPRKSIPIPMS